ncbi:MAG: UDP-N-acetylmuramoyl-tripeptide--D-alanyl-D-alanine ligase [Firmicutes bacterium HGW-Firmicutes-1]|jgi:UDP-N-acetylmuramoyl-tripeptide--D-alanyl-D-alanine ligase|nr:MAG: UDP-N-acetylmuramoyl-tripeptide--D-alanyl-D-alanine ligase [Firmicutes bacterium HGW-Firmicutes-1]
MESISIKEVIAAVGGKCTIEQEMHICRVCTDSRKVEKGDLYIALSGEVYDGHNYVEAAISKGAALAIVSRPIEKVLGVPIILVEDTLKAMWQLATYYREKLAKPVVAVTGSVGKTSTKDMIATILSASYHIHKSQGNFNNHIGMPMTILGLEESHDAIVVEMGMRGLGEISTLAHIAKPSIAVITNIGISHIERLGSRENILQAKLEIVEGLKDNGLLILNANDSLLQKVDRNITKRIVYVGVDTPADYMAYEVVDCGEEGVSFKLMLENKEYDVHIPAVGKHNVHNVLFGIACGIELGMSPEEILRGIQAYQPEKMRLNIIEKDGIKFIDDSYNASPDSMKAGLQVLSSISKGNRAIAIIGNMFELGEMASSAHYDVGKICAETGIDFSMIIGENAIDVAKGIGDQSKYKIFNSHLEIVQFLKEYLISGDIVLIKGSRGMKMEQILELM